MMAGPTAPKLPNGRSIKERIMLFGGPGIGKTHQYFQIAKSHYEMGSDAKFYGVCTDTAFEVLWMNDELPNMEWVDVSTMEQALTEGRRLAEKMRPQDWISTDLIDDIWKLAQDEYAVKLGQRDTGTNTPMKDVSDLYAVDPGEKYPIEGWEWGMPNARYRAYANNILLRCKGHAMVVSGAKPLMEESSSGKSGEKREIKEMFGHIGMKPTGQKDQPFQFHTVLYLESAGKHKQKWATAKERWGRREHLGKVMANGSVRPEAFEDFFMEYLVGTAGWEL